MNNKLETFRHQTFFEALSMADSEKTHSQTIKWFFSLPKTIITNKTKSKILNHLFQLDHKIIFEDFKAETEIESIDIIIETKSDIFAIENKLKTSEHSDQTEKYSDILTKKYEGKKIHKAFLSLIGEKPQDTNWKVLDYYNLYNALSLADINQNEKEHYIFQDYLTTLSNLTTIIQEFSKNHLSFPIVFEEKMKKGEKILTGEPYQDYVLNQNMETILNKLFMYKLGKELSNKNNLDPFKFYVTESRGNGALVIQLKEYNYKGKQMAMFFTFQNNTMKISTSPIPQEEYLKSKKDQLTSDFYGNFEKTFHFEYLKDIENWYKFKYNNPKTKARVSVTQKLNKSECILNNEFDVLVNTLINTLKTAERLSSEFVDGLSTNKHDITPELEH
jgi:hypothetical protein